MGGTEIVIFEITGKNWLMFNNPASMLGINEPEDKKMRIKKKPKPEEEIKTRFYEIDGQLYFPAVGFRTAILEACVGWKFGKIAAGRVIKGAVFCVEEECRLYDAKTKKPLTRESAATDIRRAVVQRQGIPRARPKVQGWGCKLPMEIDIDMVTKDDVLDRLQAAGKFPGVGEWRPGRNGVYGRFTVEIQKQ